MTTLYTADSFLDAIAHYMIDERNGIDTDRLVETTVNDELDAIEFEKAGIELDKFMQTEKLSQVLVKEVIKETDKAIKVYASLPTYFFTSGGGKVMEVTGTTWIPKSLIVSSPVSTDSYGSEELNDTNRSGEWILVKKWFVNKTAKEIYSKF